MELTRKNVFVTFTVLCLAASVLMGFQYIGAPVYNMIDNFIRNQEASGSSWLFWLFHSPWTDTLVQYAFALGAAYIPAYLIMCWLPKDERKSRKLSGEDFLICAVIALGVGYGLNLVGNFINFFIGMFTEKSMFDMNPVTDMAMEMTPSMILYTCIVGPFMEELMFRGFLLKRARLFGDRTAVVFTAVLFGLMHGNVAQFLYATAIGLLLGYVAVKTNGMRYSLGIHMVVNCFSMAMSFGDMVLYATGVELLPILHSLAIVVNLFVLIVAAIVLVSKNSGLWFKQLTYNNGPWSPYKIFVYANPGFVIYVFICAIEFLYYLV